MLDKLQFLGVEVDAPEPSRSANSESEISFAGESAKFYKSPTDLHEELDITEPNEIDVEAIAYSQGALVIYEPLQKCEAYTLAKDTQKAIIVVNETSIRSRQRFSVAHELGHWMRDRNLSVFCEKKNYADNWHGTNSETLANQYAKELLMPEAMFAPLVKNQPITLRTIRRLAELFGTSLTATALRLAELSSQPAVVIFSKFSRIANNEPAQKIWYLKGNEVSADLSLHWGMNNKALAYQICVDDEKHEVSGDLNADAWFIEPEVKNVKLHEESIRINCNFILTLLSWEPDIE